MAWLRHRQGFGLAGQFRFERITTVVGLLRSAWCLIPLGDLTGLSVTALLVGLHLLLHGGHGTQDSEIVFGVLEISFRRYPVPGAGRIPADLKIFLEQLLRSASKPDVRTNRIEYMAAVERLVAIPAPTTASVPELPATATTATVAAAMALATTHALYVHSLLCFCFRMLPRR